MEGFCSAIGKRTRRENENEVPEKNGGNKRRNSGTGRERALPGADSTVYRILCPVDVVGRVIGKAGKVIKSLSKETRSKIKVIDAVIPGVDDRVIVIFSSPSANDKEEKDGEDCNEGEPVCPAQDALLRVHSLIVQQSSSGPTENRQHNARLLAANSQIGGLIGKGGNNIQKLRSESGAQIQIRPKHNDELPLPGCAFSFGEVVVISGDATAVKKALYAVSAFLYKHPPKEQIPWTDILSATNPTSLLPSAVPALFTPPNYVPQGYSSQVAHHNSRAPIVGTYASHLPGLGGYGSGAAPSSWPLTYNPALPIAPKSGNSAFEKSPEEFCIRIVCPNDKIGGVIGKGGNTIKSMRKDTGASIKVEDAQSDSDERVIVVSATELANDRVSPTLEAVLQLQGKTSGSTDNDGDVCTRLLVPSNHIGCLLGKGGNIITEMRKQSGANIRIFRKEERPKCASQNEELVQVTGEPSVARDALIQITKRLRENIFKDTAVATNTHTVPPLSSLPTAVPLSSSSYNGTRQYYDLGLPSTSYNGTSAQHDLGLPSSSYGTRQYDLRFPR